MSSKHGLRLLAAVVWLLSCVFLTSGCGEPEETTRADRDKTTTESSDRAVAAVDEGSSPQATAREPKFSSPLTREGGKEGAADRIRDVRFEVLGGYERAIIEFGGPLKRAGRVPVWTLSWPASSPLAPS